VALTISSPAFTNGAEIPSLHTCDGKDVSPELRFGGVPQGAKSLALVVHDPDAPDPAAPRMDWVHWVLYNLPPGATSLPQGIRAEDLPAGALQGMNDWKRTGWGGPCPPKGRHRYFFKLYALDAELPLAPGATKDRLLEAMKGHVLAVAELMGTYQRR
jgi:Raf kinase inhibitor-like YbhB/YbcL family protein